MDSGAAGNDVYFGYGIVKAAAADAYLTANGCAGDGGGEPGGDFTLSANGYKSKGVKKVDLTFNGAAGTNVDVYRDGSLIATTSASSTYTDSISAKGGGSYSYKACDEGTSTCTTEQTVVF